MNETALDAAARHVDEAEQRRARQISLIAELAGEQQAHARQLLAEIERTLAIATTHGSFLLSLRDDE